jgi:catechol 2,3-dioxygenase-like lactoylglutathione lyase family enzyme
MKIRSQHAGIITGRLPESREFYTRVFGFEAVYDCGWYVHLRNGGAELGLLEPGHASQPRVLQQEFGGRGAWIYWEVDDVDAECARIESLRIPLVCPLRDEPWGERHFAVQDPNGVAINISAPIPMKAEYRAFAKAPVVAGQ